MEHLCLIHQVPLNPTLLCGRVCHPFALIKSWLFSSPHFSCSISSRDCFFLSAPLPPWSQCIVSSEPYLPVWLQNTACFYTVTTSSIHRHALGLVVFLSTWIQYHLTDSSHTLLSSFHYLLVSSDFFPHHTPAITTDGHILLPGVIM